jgi:hypothetical protein
LQIARRDGLGLVTNCMNGYDASTLHKEPENARVQFADVPQFEQSVTERLRKRLTVIAPVAQLG